MGFFDSYADWWTRRASRFVDPRSPVGRAAGYVGQVPGAINDIGESDPGVMGDVARFGGGLGPPLAAARFLLSAPAEEAPTGPAQPTHIRRQAQVGTDAYPDSRSGELDEIERQSAVRDAMEVERQKSLSAQGFTNYAPGVSYKMGGSGVGPPRTISAFGRNIQVPVGGGSASMMEISGNTPGSERLAVEAHQKRMGELNRQREAEIAGMPLREQIDLQTGGKDYRLRAFQQGMGLTTQIQAAEEQAEREFIDEARKRGMDPTKISPEVRAAARQRGVPPSLRMQMKLVEDTLTGSRAMFGE